MLSPSFIFEYPAQPHRRKHGPAGYTNYQRYREWLRDEFEFRCVFCLWREAWGWLEGIWEIDHFVPLAIRPDSALDYENLLYSCRHCNNCKRAHLFPDPCEEAYGAHLRVETNGRIVGKTREGRRMIRLLKLDRPTARRTRKLYIGIERSLANSSLEHYRVFMGYPEVLPDIESLAAAVPRNTRPEGVAESCLARRKRGVLPLTY